MSSVMSKKVASSDSDEIDLARLFGELLDHRKLIISLTAVLTVLAIVYALFATPIFQADAMIQVEQKQGNAILESLSQVLPDAQPLSEPEIALLQSRMILGKTVDDLDLQIAVEQKYFPLFGRGWARLTGKTPGQLSISRLYLPDSDTSPHVVVTVVDKTHYLVDGDGFQLKGEVDKLVTGQGISIFIDQIQAQPGTRFDVYYSSRLKTINDLQKTLLVADQGKDTGILNLTLNGDNRELVAAILNSISQNYLDQNIAREAEQDAKSLDFLQQQLPQVRAQLDASEDKLNAYRKQKDSIDLSMEARSVLDQIVNVEAQLNQLTFREAEISQLYTKDHPTYKALLEKRQTLQQERVRLNKTVAAMPSTQQEVARLSRDVESDRAIYMQLLNRQQELGIAKSSAIGNVRIIDHAITEIKPVKPNKILVVIIGFILGGFLSVGIVLVKAFLHRGIESPEQLENIGVNVYASIPISEWLVKNSTKKNGDKFKSKKINSPRFLALDNPADLSIEAIRSLRTSLHFAMLDATNNILMISGPSPNAGKSFISTNLTIVMAQADKKVLLIDADLRRGVAHKTLGTQNQSGLSDLIMKGLSIESTVQKIERGGFDFISKGGLVANPAELLMHYRFAELLTWASENYDLVIIDTPPILAVTDAAIIGRYAGTSILVARFEQSTVKEVEVSIRRFEQSGVEIKGCILNGIEKKFSSYYSYGYSHYGYDYKDKKNV